MSAQDGITKDGVLEELTLPELIEVWAEDEIARRLREVDLFSSHIVRGASDLGLFHVRPERGGFHDGSRSVEVLVEVQDHRVRESRIGAWSEKKYGQEDVDAFERAYVKAMAHAIIQLLPASVWRPWVRAELTS